MRIPRFLISWIRRNDRLVSSLKNALPEIFPDTVAVLDRPLTSAQRENRAFLDLLKSAAQKSSPDTVVVLDYPVDSKERWDTEHPHPELHGVIDQNRKLYEDHLRSFLPFLHHYIRIPEQQPANDVSAEPCWINGFMPALDGVALYGFLVMNRPEYYIEIGSGNSTKFARRAIRDHGLETKIISIDPHPRAEIDKICDEVIRQPVENVDLAVFERLGANDILYVDDSHRTLMNSDATVVFLEIIPRLKPGVLVEIHDINLPYDYPPEWIERYYSEQYLLAAYLLARGSRFDIELPNMFVSRDPELRTILSPLWQREEMKNVETHGGSFWIRIR